MPSRASSRLSAISQSRSSAPRSWPSSWARGSRWHWVKRQAEVLSGLVREEAVGLSALVDAAHRVESAAAALGEADSVVSSRRFRSELEAALSGGAPRGTRRAGAVRIVRVSDVSRLSSDLLIVARASEGAFEPALESP